MAWKNTSYRGPDIMIQLMRATNIPWQISSIENGYLISNFDQRERLAQPLIEKEGIFSIPHTKFSNVDEREMRNLHSQCSRKSSSPVETPNSKYVSMTSSRNDIGWGEGSNQTWVYLFDIWRSDVWKGKHEISRDKNLESWYKSNLEQLPSDKVVLVMAEQTPPDWDRGLEFEWLALGGTKIYNVKKSLDGKKWTSVDAPKEEIMFWWDALPQKI